jgi:hypothetical protein
MDTTTLLKSVALRFVRGALSGAVSSMAVISYADVSTLTDLNRFLAGLAVAGIIGAVTGALMSADKFLRSVGDN